MSHESVASGPDESSLAEIKQMSGRRIEDERRRQGLTQPKLAKRAGLSVSWIREIESGNPRTRIDDHLRCVAALGMPPCSILIPMLFKAHGKSFPPQLLAGNLHELECQLLEFIVNHAIADMRRTLSSDRGEGPESAFPHCANEPGPKWRNPNFNQ
jgi:transcriptional regulator with XRE-family HTH domain